MNILILILVVCAVIGALRFLGWFLERRFEARRRRETEERINKVDGNAEWIEYPNDK